MKQITAPTSAAQAALDSSTDLTDNQWRQVEDVVASMSKAQLLAHLADEYQLAAPTSVNKTMLGVMVVRARAWVATNTAAAAPSAVDAFSSRMDPNGAMASALRRFQPAEELVHLRDAALAGKLKRELRTDERTDPIAYLRWLDNQANPNFEDNLVVADPGKKWSHVAILSPDFEDMIVTLLWPSGRYMLVRRVSTGAYRMTDDGRQFPIMQIDSFATVADEDEATDTIREIRAAYRAAKEDAYAQDMGDWLPEAPIPMAAAEPF